MMLNVLNPAYYDGAFVAIGSA